MGKTIIILILLVLLSTIVIAQNFRFLYNPFTAKLDRTLSLNQSGFNQTSDFIFGANVSNTTGYFCNNIVFDDGSVGSSSICDGSDATGAGGSGTVYNKENYTAEYASTGYDKENYTLEYAATGYNKENYTAEYTSTGFKLGNQTPINSTAWERTGISVILANIGDLVGINISTPSHGLSVFTDILFNFSADQHLEIDATRPKTTDAIFIDFVAGITGVSVLHTEIDINSFPDTKFAIIDYDANGLGPEQFAEVLSFTLDVGGSTGGSIDAIHVTEIGEGVNTAEVHGLSLEHGVNPIFQESGEATFADVYILNTSTGVINITKNATSSSSNIVMFETNGDILMVGHNERFSDIEVILNRSAGNPGIQPAFFHSNATEWESFTPSDGTRGFRDNGVIRWELSDIEDNWIQTTENNQTKFWIRIDRTKSGGLTAPFEEVMEIVTTTVFEWNELGDVNINTLSLLGDINYSGDNLTIQGTTGALHIFGTPDVNNIFTVLDVHGNVSAANPEFRIHLKGAGRAIHSYESFMITDTVGHLCSKDTTLVDCNESTTGPDLYVLDDFAVLDDSFLGNGTVNITSEGEIFANGTITTSSNIVALGDIFGNRPNAFKVGNGTALFCTLGAQFKIANGTALVMGGGGGDIGGTVDVPTIDANAVQDAEIDYGVVTLNDFTNDAGYLSQTNITNHDIVGRNTSNMNITMVNFNSTCGGFRFNNSVNAGGLFSCL